MSRERELLERAYQYIPMSSVTSQEIRAYLAEPEVPFVRLTEEEVNSLMNRSLPSYELICAVENRLVEKNRDR